MRLSASQLGSFSRCPRAYAYERLEGKPGRLLSATAFGSVLHVVLHAFERSMADGTKTFGEARQFAYDTFEHYWHPSNIELVAGGVVDEWIKGQTYASLRQRGHAVLDAYFAQWLDDDVRLLSLEHPFEVPLDGTEHTISGYVDKLSERKKSRNWVLEVLDYKSGKRQFHLRQNLQLTTYAYASTKRQFWEPFAALGYDVDQLWEGYASWPRHTVWFDMEGTETKPVDGGYRGSKDYARLVFAANETARSIAAGIFPLNVSGDTCTWCPHRSYCPDGTGTATEDEYDPNRQPLMIRGE